MAIHFVTLLNEAELDEKLTTDSYVSFFELVDQGYFRSVQSDVGVPYLDVLKEVNTENDAEPLPGWELTLDIASDKNSYALILREKTAMCPVTLLSDDSGTIRERKDAACASGKQ